MYLKANEIKVNLEVLKNGKLNIPIDISMFMELDLPTGKTILEAIVKLLNAKATGSGIESYDSDDGTVKLMSYVSNVSCDASESFVCWTIVLLMNITGMIANGNLLNSTRNEGFMSALVGDYIFDICGTRNIGNAARWSSRPLNEVNVIEDICAKRNVSGIYVDSNDNNFITSSLYDDMCTFGIASPLSRSASWSTLSSSNTLMKMPSKMLDALKSVWRSKSATSFVPYTNSYWIDSASFREPFIMALACELYAKNRIVSPAVFKISHINSIIGNYVLMCNAISTLEGHIVVIDLTQMTRLFCESGSTQNPQIDIVFNRIKRLVALNPSITWIAIADETAPVYIDRHIKSFKKSMVSMIDLTDTSYNKPEITRYVSTLCESMNLSQYSSEWTKMLTRRLKDGTVTEYDICTFVRNMARYVLKDADISEFGNSDLIIMDDCNPKVANQIKDGHQNDSVSLGGRERTSSRKSSKRQPKDSMDSLIGLVEIKDCMKKIIDHNKLLSTYRKNGMCMNNLSRHMIFTGNPGTAKTSMARAFYNELLKNKIVMPGKFIEVGCQDLVAKYVGQTAPLVEQAFNRAKGGVLFIDEAYSLAIRNSGGFGEEAISVIVQQMENHRDDVIVILAGYKKEMTSLVRSNPGLRSRIAFTIDFPDYNPDELTKIALSIASSNNFKIDKTTESYIKEQLTKNPLSTDLGNGRFARNLIERAIINHSTAIINKVNSISDDELHTLSSEDLSNGWNEVYNDAFKDPDKQHSVGF